MSFENYGLLVKHIMNLFHLISLGMGDTERHMQWAFRHLLGAEIHLQIHSVLFHRSSGCHVATFDICLTFPIHLWVGLFFFLARTYFQYKQCADLFTVQFLLAYFPQGSSLIFHATGKQLYIMQALFSTVFIFFKSILSTVTSWSRNHISLIWSPAWPLTLHKIVIKDAGRRLEIYDQGTIKMQLLSERDVKGCCCFLIVFRRRAFAPVIRNLPMRQSTCVGSW